MLYKLFQNNNIDKKKKTFERYLEKSNIPYKFLRKEGKDGEFNYLYMLHELLDEGGNYENNIEILIVISNYLQRDSIIFNLGGFDEQAWRREEVLDKLLQLNSHSVLQYFIMDGCIRGQLNYHCSTKYEYTPEFFIELLVEAYISLKNDYLEIAKIAWG